MTDQERWAKLAEKMAQELRLRRLRAKGEPCRECLQPIEEAK